VIGMKTLIGLRREGHQPGAVFVYLVPQLGPLDVERYALSLQGNVDVSIPASEPLSGIDFRPLVGLQVHVTDVTGDRARHRKVAAMVAEVNPRLLVMPVADGDGFTVHIRRAGDPPTTETIRM